MALFFICASSLIFIYSDAANGTSAIKITNTLYSPVSFLMVLYSIIPAFESGSSAIRPSNPTPFTGTAGVSPCFVIICVLPKDHDVTVRGEVDS